MSGGYFNYSRFTVQQEIIERLQELISKNEDGYNSDILNKFRECLINFEDGCTLLHHIDYLVSGDIGEDRFWEKLDDRDSYIKSREELDNYKKIDKAMELL